MEKKLDIRQLKIEDLKPADYNPRKISEKAYKELVKSMELGGQPIPIVVNMYKGRENVIVGGHQRYNIAKNLGWETIACSIVNYNKELEVEMNLRFNKNGGEWDWDMLLNVNEDILLDIGFEKEDFNFLQADKIDETYTKKLVPPVYEPSKVKPEVKELYNCDKTNKLKESADKIEDKDVREFLLNACNRFTVFNYAKIADYYAHSKDKKIKDLMEKLALVIIDFDKAVENGFVKISKELFDLRDKDKYEK